MYLTWKDVLTLWMPWPQIILILVASGVLYGRGWWYLRQRGARLANGWRLVSFLSGLVALGIAMLSAVEVLHDILFTLHMVQHLLIMMVGAPLIMLADPYPFILWGLPPNPRRALIDLLTPWATIRRRLRRFATPWAIWGVYVGATWLWHVPVYYDAALRSELLHVIEHIAFFATALLYWWIVTGATPRLHGRLGYGFRIGYSLATLAQNEVLGVAIAFASEPLYPYYTTVPRLWGLSVLEDQALGAALMWVPGGMMYALSGIILLARFLDQEEKQVAQDQIAIQNTQ